MNLRDIVQYAKVSRADLKELFLLGEGEPTIFECCFLTYLEMEVLAKGQNVDAVWVNWVALCSIDVPKGQKPTPLSLKYGHGPKGRKKLVEQLEAYVLRFALPASKQFTTSPPKVDEPKEVSKPKKKVPGTQMAPKLESSQIKDLFG